MSVDIHRQVTRPVTMTVGGVQIHGVLSVPDGAVGLVVIAYGTGDSRNTPATRKLAGILANASLATFACDLLSPEEEVISSLTGQFRSDATLQSGRLRVVLDWCATQPELDGLPVGVLGAGTAVDACALVASIRADVVRSLVLCGGELTYAWNSLPLIEAPTLLIAGELDAPLVTTYSRALYRFRSTTAQLDVIEKAGRLFIEPGAREQLGQHAARWFVARLGVLIH